MAALRYGIVGGGFITAFMLKALRQVRGVEVAGLADTEAAVEKLQASRGLLPVQPNEADLYGYTDENVDAVEAFTQGRPPMLNWEYGLEIVRLTMAAYLSAERGRVVDLTDPATLAELENYIPLIQQGRGGEVLPISAR